MSLSIGDLNPVKLAKKAVSKASESVAPVKETAKKAAKTAAKAVTDGPKAAVEGAKNVGKKVATKAAEGPKAALEGAKNLGKKAVRPVDPPQSKKTGLSKTELVERVQSGRIQNSIDELKSTKAGAEIGKYLDGGNVEIEVKSDDEYQKLKPGSGGVYIPKDNKIVIPEKALQNKDGLVGLLAHEGQHALDYRPKSGIAKIKDKLPPIVSGLDDGAKAVLQLKNPINATVEGTHKHVLETEFNAYKVAAEVDKERGVDPTTGYGRFAVDDKGELLSDEKIFEQLENHELYKWDKFYDKPQTIAHKAIAGAAFGLPGVFATVVDAVRGDD